MKDVKKSTFEKYEDMLTISILENDNEFIKKQFVNSNIYRLCPNVGKFFISDYLKNNNIQMHNVNL